MSLEHQLNWLYNHVNLEAKGAGHVEGLSLDTMRALALLLGEPHLDYPVVQVTGTNGKGSTSHLTTLLLVEHGLSVGTYASPHVSAINERVQHDAQPIDDDMLEATLADVRVAADHLDVTPSWFELMTATAFRYFNDAAVQAAVVEVGMLGRYDATNIADAAVAVVTNVQRDHTDGAEGWRQAIAGEKAGIIGPDSVLVLGETDDDLVPIFEAEGPATTLLAGRDFELGANRVAIGGRLIDVRTPRASYDDVFVALHGEHQGHNALLAIVAAEALLDHELDRDHLDLALATAHMPGRFEVLGREPLIVVDGAHNPDGAARAAATMAEEFTVLGQRMLVVGMMREKDPEAMLEAFDAKGADIVICTEPRWPRALPAAELGDVARSMGIVPEVIASPVDALERAEGLATESDAILVAGSLYVVGTVRDHLLARAESEKATDDDDDPYFE